MCGIFGLVSSRNFNKSDFVIKSLQQSLAHRGPDNSELKSFYNENFSISIGHARLSIIDISSRGNQPMIFENLCLTYNGEIYNYKEIRTKLEEVGYVFFSDSDTEVVLKAYHFWGNKCLNYFNGMWAFAIYNFANNELFLSRDRLGVKPLYYFFDSSNLFCFASELKAIINSNIKTNKINQNSVSEFLENGFITAPNTIFTNCHKVPPGTFIKLKIRNDKIEIIEKKFWDLGELYGRPRLTYSRNQVIEELEELLLKAVEYRMISDVPVGLFLSGGIDSSLVASLLADSKRYDLLTFNISFSSNEYDEGPNARAIASYLKTEHHEMKCEREDVYKILDILPATLSEPFADSSIIPTMLVSEFASKYVKVVLSGDGGDEFFWGYPLLKKVINTQKKINYLKKILSTKKIDLLYGIHNILGRNDRISKVISLANSSNDLYSLYSSYSKYWSSFETKKYLDKSQDFPNKSLSNAFHDSLNIADLLTRISQINLPNDMLCKVDTASMNYSIEAREPLLDFNLINFATQIPFDFFQSKEYAEKSLLKEILYRKLPESLLVKKKMGFSVPPAYIRTYVEARFNENDINDLVGRKILNSDVKKLRIAKMPWRMKWPLFQLNTWLNYWE